MAFKGMPRFLSRPSTHPTPCAFPLDQFLSGPFEKRGGRPGFVAREKNVHRERFLFLVGLLDAHLICPEAKRFPSMVIWILLIWA